MHVQAETLTLKPELNVEVECELTLVKRINPATECAYLLSNKRSPCTQPLLHALLGRLQRLTVSTLPEQKKSNQGRTGRLAVTLQR
jgi:hypothetical protein